MSRMFQVMLIVCIVNNTLDIAFIVTDRKLDAENIIVSYHPEKFNILFRIPAKKLLQPAMEFMNTVGLVIHQDTLTCNVINISFLQFLQGLFALRSLLNPYLLESPCFSFFYNISSLVFPGHYNEPLCLRRKRFNIRKNLCLMYFRSKFVYRDYIHPLFLKLLESSKTELPGIS